MLASLCLLFTLLADPTAPAELRGQVIGPDAKPVASATIYSSNGSQTATSDDQGIFTFAGVDPSLKYDLLVLADGFRPMMIKNADPRRAARAQLQVLPSDLDRDQMLHGRAVDVELAIGRLPQVFAIAATGE